MSEIGNEDFAEFKMGNRNSKSRNEKKNTATVFTDRILRNLKWDHMVFLNENIRHRIFGLGLFLSVRCQKLVHAHLFI